MISRSASVRARKHAPEVSHGRKWRLSIAIRYSSACSLVTTFVRFPTAHLIERVGGVDGGQRSRHERCGVRIFYDETLDVPPVRLELVRERCHRGRGDLHRHENLVAIAKKALGLKVARMPKDRDHDREERHQEVGDPA